MVTKSTPAGVRHRYIADRIMMLLLYMPANPEFGVEREEDGIVILKMGPFAKYLAMNSSKLYDQMLFLHHAGYIARVDPVSRWGYLVIHVTPPAAYPSLQTKSNN